jgi:tripartite-type tricarboxylate transporter receptor subunit TctC
LPTRIAFALLLLLLSLVSSCAADYPDKPVRLILAAAAGTTLDLASRLVGDKLTRIWGQPLVIENRPGGNLIIGTQAIVNAKPDGYTLLGTPGSIAQNVALRGKELPYDTLTDLVPVTLLHNVQIFYVVDSRIPATTFGEFLALARANPGKFNFATYGFGTTAHLLALKLNRDAHVDLVPVPYAGTGAAVTAVMAGDAAAAMAEYASISQHAERGKLRVLAVTGAHRSAFAPDVPTFEECGIPGFAVTTWAGWFAPKDTPQPIITRIAHGVADVLALPDIRARYRELTAEPVGSDPAEFRSMMTREVAYWTTLVNASGMAAK